ncbi:MAG: hypothetical protein ABGX07_01115 [Pirellulaceae bacterium]
MSTEIRRGSGYLRGVHTHGLDTDVASSCVLHWCHGHYLFFGCLRWSSTWVKLDLDELCKTIEISVGDMFDRRLARQNRNAGGALKPCVD